jgi:hypothetical protein
MSLVVENRIEINYQLGTTNCRDSLDYINLIAEVIRHHQSIMSSFACRS